MRRRTLLALAVAGLVATLATPGRAQVNNNGFGDPFFLYYGWFVPQQAYQASIPRQEDQLRQMAIQRQVNALTERAVLTDPAALGSDPLRAFGDPGRARLPRTAPGGTVTTHVGGAGPSGYFNRAVTSNRVYFPGLRSGRAAPSRLPNPAASLSPSVSPLGTVRTRSARGFGGGYGMGGMGFGGFQ